MNVLFNQEVPTPSNDDDEPKSTQATKWAICRKPDGNEDELVKFTSIPPH